MARKKGDNKHGFKNEAILAKSLNNKRLKKLNTNLKKFVKYIANCEGIQIDDSTLIHARYEKNNKLKQDFYISIGDKEFGISVKMGKGGSTHQEKCEEFISFLSSDRCTGITDEIKDDIRIMIWCDGTKDGSGDPSERMTANQYVERYQDGYKRIQSILKENEEVLVRRDLLEGRFNSKVDYIYHGTKESGRWISGEEVIELHTKNSLVGQSGAFLRLGRMTLQVYS